MGWRIKGNYTYLKRIERKRCRDRHTKETQSGRWIKHKRGKNESNQVFTKKSSRSSWLLEVSFFSFSFFFSFLLRLLWQRSECHYSVCRLFPARQWPRGLPWNNGKPLPVSIPDMNTLFTNNLKVIQSYQKFHLIFTVVFVKKISPELLWHYIKRKLHLLQFLQNNLQVQCGGDHGSD